MASLLDQRRSITQHAAPYDPSHDGLDGCHLHEFHIGGIVYATPDPEDEGRVVVDDRRSTLQRVLPGISRFVYLYDFGDDWRHTITVEKVESSYDGDSDVYAHLEAGERACPPEDSGGPLHYQEFLDQFAKDPQQADVRDFLIWAGKSFDPGRFDRDTVNATLSCKTWNRPKKK